MTQRFRLLFSLLQMVFGIIPALPAEMTPVTTNSKQFSFTATSLGSQKREDEFCLPRDEQLVRVLRVNVNDSNSRSNVNVQGDIGSNCIKVSVMIPPARQICTSVPAPTFLSPSQTRELCQAIPSELAFTVDYESQKRP